MSQIDLESFHRLEEFPSYTSCIRSFGRPIIPPLVTLNNVLDLRQLRAAAINKEVEILQKKQNHLREEKDEPTLSMLLENVSRSEFQSSMQDSCALWYPSYLDNQEVSVAISKFPTSGIYSSVHTDAIVCSNVVGSNHVYDSESVKDVYLDAGASMADCVECSHRNINLECSLCLAEFNQSLCHKSFPEDLSPEVPCRTFSLMQHNDLSVMDRELNNSVGDVECESLPTVICNQKNILHDTDSESNATCMTQSTDLEKYMELSCEFSSPDNSAVIWDSKISSQQCTLSKSDDASSETIVNTENELTPCASTMAELTDNIEDEFSNAEEVASTSNNNKMITGEMRRSHSVDSYMKILHNCTKSLNVKKSHSEPFNTNNASISADMIEVKATVAAKTNLLIKEDSKESEEAQDVPEKDDCALEVEAAVKEDKTVKPNALKTDPFQKKHVRQNSYTLDRPSSALILAHADCACNFDAKCISPHCSALKDTKDVPSNSAFIKEKVDVTAPPLPMKILPVLNSETTLKGANFSKEDISSTVVDVFPHLKENSSEKSDSGNTEKSANVCAIGITEDLKFDIEGYLTKNFFEDLNLSNQPKHREYIQHICEEFKVSHDLRVKELQEEQHRQWLKLKEEFKEQEKLLNEKVNAIKSSRVLLSETGDDIIKSNSNYCDLDKTSEGKCMLQNELPVSNSGSLSDHIPTSDSSSSTQTSPLSIPHKSSPSFSPIKMTVLPENARALSPSKEYVSSVENPSKTFEAIKTKQVSKDSNVPMTSKNPMCISSEAPLEVNGFNPPSSFVPHYNSLPEYPSAIAVPIYDNCDKRTTCFCDNAFQPCRCCASLNGYSECGVNTSPPYSMPPSQKPIYSYSRDRSSQFDSVTFEKQHSPCSAVCNKSVDSPDFNNSKVDVTNLSKKSNDSISSTQNSISRSLDNSELSNVQYHDKEQRRDSPFSAKHRIAVDNLVSAYANKPTKNGTCILHDAAFNKKININPFLMKKFEKLPAFVKGYLTRRLFNTEYVQNLIKNFKDTALIIGKMRDDLPTKGDSISQGDIDFQRQLIVLLMKTYDDFYETFFNLSIKEQMNIIMESRNFRLKPKNTSQEQEQTQVVQSNSPEFAASKPHKLSSATLKVLERRKRPTIDSRTYTVHDMRKARSRSVLDMSTYTIDDIPTFRGRAQSSMSSKGVAFSPTSVLKNSVGLKRKTASAKSSGSKGCVHQKWVP